MFSFTTVALIFKAVNPGLAGKGVIHVALRRALAVIVITMIVSASYACMVPVTLSLSKCQRVQRAYLLGRE